MNKIDSKTIHEYFHDSTNIQKRVIADNNFTYRNIIEELNRNIRQGDRIFDIGCGSGTICFYLASKKHKVLGIDISDKAVNACKESARYLSLEDYARFKQMLFPDEIPDEKYDFIVFTEVLEHLENDELALKKIYSLLNKDGRVLITTPSKNAPLFRLGLAKKFDEKVGHLRRYTLEEVVDLCEKAGLKTITTKKKEGLLRNFLFINPVAGKFIRIINRFNLTDIVTSIDNFTMKIFGESDIVIVAQKK